MEGSKKNVIKTLEFDNPNKIPTQLWNLPWADIHYPNELQNIKRQFPDDIISAPELLSETIRTLGDPYKIGEYVDEWGCLFENRQEGIIGEVKNPIVNTWEKVNDVHFPNEFLSIKFEEINSFCQNNNSKFIISPCCARPFERIQFLRGSENIYMDFYESKDEFESLLKNIHDFNCKRMETWAKTEVDALFIMDDWGAQNSLLISPEIWREIFKPLYKEYVEIAKKNGKYIFMHSDGNILSIVPDLIEIGVDALNSQIFAMGLNNLNELKGEITFWGEIDRQHMLPNFSVKEIENGVEEVYQELYADGGIIGQCEFGPGAKPENVYTVFDTWQKILNKNNFSKS